ncbi:DEAD/DEAH box helicase [Ferrimonas pelagia]|uniref:DEAD/DEAH box helicase n=1 Tax=Ferrimonas pelagia TaxID=1177826 RepID=A0ABP9FCB7_9GAMM
MSFAALPLHAALIQRLAQLNYQQPTPIQLQAIPGIIEGKDVMAGAQTGTGKTAAFALPLIHRWLQHNEQPKSPQVLVLAPTRELAQQVNASFEQYAQGTELKTIALTGGNSQQAQAEQLRLGIDIVIATPGRLLDHLRKRTISFDGLKTLVLDEADRMLDMGFQDEITDVLKRLPAQRQTLLFTATVDERMSRFGRRLLRSPQVIEIAPRNTTAAMIHERIYNVDPNKKTALLCHLIKQEGWQQTVVFSRKRQDADKVAKQMQQAGIHAEAFHADLTQSARESVLAQFRRGEITALIATDVAARGLDIDALNYVVNMELPFRGEDYVHRIGRTGRAGNEGHAITLLSVDDEPLLIKLEALLDRRLPQQWYPGFEPDLTQVAPTTRKTKRGALKQQARKKALAKHRR